MEAVIGAVVGLIAGLGVILLAQRIPVEAEARKMETAPEAAGQGDSPATDGSETQPRPEHEASGLPFFGPLEIGLVLLSGALTSAAFLREGVGLMALILSAYVWVLLLISLIDIRYRLILDVIMIPAFALALIELLTSRRIAIGDGLMGYAIGQIAVIAVYVFGALYLWIVNSGRDEKIDEVPFGFGDVTLATFCGLFLGYPRVVLMLLVMVVVGALMAIAAMLINLLRDGRYQAHAVIPYGPAIASAAVIMLLWGEAVARLLGAP